ncbi:MAG: HDOD domain-containing protein [Phycisphaeraceae bacterium]|nr:HDOD domain-containing protein [Phycisphaeraceae bacterium]
MSAPSLQKVLSCSTLPSLPSAAVRLLELTADPHVTITQIAGAIQSDPAMATKVLKTVNSSYYALQQPCRTIQRALGYLGLNTVKSVALGFSLVECSKGASKSGFDLDAYWRRATFCAAGAKRLATETRACDPEEAFLGALVQDIGMLACNATFGQDYAAVIHEAGEDHDRLFTTERQALGFDHCSAGEALAERWKLPPSLVRCIARHHLAVTENSEFTALVRVVALAGVFAGALTLKSNGEKIERAGEWGKSWFGLTSERVVGLIESAAADGAELARALEVRTGENPDIAAILASAQERLVMQQIELQHNNEVLVKQTVTDALTGAYNRRYFDDTVSAAFKAACQPGGSVSVLFIDADKFKAVNDEHGHKAGDAVLMELSRRLAEHVGDAGDVCRYGGEEFGVILPASTLDRAMEMAESLRAAMEATPVSLEGTGAKAQAIKVTISVGVASMEPGAGISFASPEALVHAADQGVYAAKRGGRNRVCMATEGAIDTARAARPLARAASTPRDESSARVAIGGTPAVHAARPGGIVKQSPASAAAAKPASGTPVMEILLIEDDPMAAHLMSLLLQKRCNARVTVTGSCEEALSALEKGIGPRKRPDLILCDMLLPGMNGEQFVRELRTRPVFGITPVIVVSASTEQADRELCLKAGANAYALKTEMLSDFDRWLAGVIQTMSGAAKAAA